MKAIGIINITDELTLKDPSLEVAKVSYNWVNDFVDIEIFFTEGVYKHSRTFRYDTTPYVGSLTTNYIL